MHASTPESKFRHTYADQLLLLASCFIAEHTHTTHLCLSNEYFVFVLRVIRLCYYFVIRPPVTLNVFYVSLNKTDLFTKFFHDFCED